MGLYEKLTLLWRYLFLLVVLYAVVSFSCSWGAPGQQACDVGTSVVKESPCGS